MLEQNRSTSCFLILSTLAGKKFAVLLCRNAIALEMSLFLNL